MTCKRCSHRAFDDDDDDDDEDIRMVNTHSTLYMLALFKDFENTTSFDY